ncbi:MAG: NADH-quinone oxidoreductase subunit J [FCB group bacterium]|nr:NADH-quinone oxidoreductase subunit J [FCB group bacterium]
MAEVAFIIIAAITLASAFFVVFSSNLMYSGVALFFTLFGVAGLYVFLYADFLAATQIMVYVGGIMVLILFGIMLTNKIASTDLRQANRGRFMAGLSAFILFLLISAIAVTTQWHTGSPQFLDTTVAKLGMMILYQYLLPFEVASILLLAALIGAALLSRKK